MKKPDPTTHSPATIPLHPEIEIKVVIPSSATHQRHVDSTIHAIARSVRLGVNGRARVYQRKPGGRGWVEVVVPDHANEGGMTD